MFSSLKSKTDFDHVYEKGKIFGNRNFTLRYVKNGKDANRLGIVVSKKYRTERSTATGSADRFVKLTDQRKTQSSKVTT